MCWGHLRLAWLVPVHLLALASSGAARLCLHDGVPPAERANLIDDGEEVPLGFWELQWDSAGLATHVAKILVEEHLGFNAEVSGHGLDSQSGVYATAGCLDPNGYSRNAAGCSRRPRIRHHVALEIWGFDKYQRASDHWQREGLPHDLLPEHAGPIGYEGEEGAYVFSEQLNEAYAASGTPLEYYKMYDVAWNRPWQHFDGFDALGQEGLRDCTVVNDAPHLKANAVQLQIYMDLTGDIDGVVNNSGTLSERCWGGSWWLSPACRERPETCVPFVTPSLGWGFYDRMQQAAMYNMPIAVSAAASFPRWVSISRSSRILTYWFRPDISFIDLEAKILVLPTHNASQHREGIRITAAVNVVLWKSLAGNLRRLDHRLHEFLDKLSIDLASLEMMLSTKRASTAEVSNAEVACEWIRRSQGIWSSWLPDALACQPGEGLVDANNTFVSDMLSATRCRMCPEGRRSVRHHEIRTCDPCPVGTSQPRGGQDECLACEPGMFTDVEGERVCRRCAQDTYQSARGSTGCLTCPSPTVTKFMGARSLSECVCPAGMYRSADDRAPRALQGAAPPAEPSHPVCRRCPAVGLTCPANSSEATVRVEPGFMTLEGGDALEPFRCMPAELCPGGAPGSCAENRDSSKLACGECRPNFFAVEGGACHRCQDDQRVVIFVVGPLVLLIMLVGLTYAINQDVVVQPHPTLTCALLFAIMFTWIQSISIFGQLTVEWPEPIKTLFAEAQLITFKLQNTKLDCLLHNAVQVKFVFRQLIAVACVIIVALILLVKHRRSLRWTQYRIELVNTTGTIFQVMFISVAISATSPWICYPHPGGARSSMVDSPHIECYSSGEWRVLVAIGIAAFLVVLVPYMALVVYGTIKYRRLVLIAQMSQGNGLHSYRFLFFRFRPKCYYYSSIILLRNLAMCFVAMLPNGGVQLQTMGIVLLAGATVQLSLQPWRSKMANWVDGILTCVMVQLLVCVSMTTRFAGIDAMVGKLGITFFGAAFGLVVCCVIWRLYRAVRPSPFFHRAICHYKGEAGAQARFLQHALKIRTGQRVFLDADNLINLDELFNVVCYRTRQLIVYLTSSTLRKPWCAGEITVAHEAGKQVLAVKTPHFKPPTEVELGSLGLYVETSSMELTRYGLTMDRVAAAFDRLLSKDTVEIKARAELPGVAMFTDIVTELTGKPQHETSVQAETRLGQIVVVSDPQDSEATAAAGILLVKLSEDVLSVPISGIHMLADQRDLTEEKIIQCIARAAAVVIVLSNESMTSRLQLCAIHQAMVRLEEAKEASLEQQPGPTWGSEPVIFDGRGSPPNSSPADSSPGCSSAPCAPYESARKRINRTLDVIPIPTIEHISSISSATTSRSAARAPSVCSASAARESTFSVVPVNIPTFSFPEESYWTTTFAFLRPRDTERDAECIRGLFKLPFNYFSTDSTNEVLNAQARDIGHRLPQRQCATWENPTAVWGLAASAALEITSGGRSLIGAAPAGLRKVCSRVRTTADFSTVKVTPAAAPEPDPSVFGTQVAAEAGSSANIRVSQFSELSGRSMAESWNSQQAPEPANIVVAQVSDLSGPSKAESMASQQAPEPANIVVAQVSEVSGHSKSSKDSKKKGHVQSPPAHESKSPDGPNFSSLLE